jgi:hypothetical protein
MTIKNTNKTIGNRTRELPACSAVYGSLQALEIAGKWTLPIAAAQVVVRFFMRHLFPGNVFFSRNKIYIQRMFVKRQRTTASRVHT